LEGLLGCLQMLLGVGTGTEVQLVVVDEGLGVEVGLPVVTGQG
jgi:hypothetical protein